MQMLLDTPDPCGDIDVRREVLKKGGRSTESGNISIYRMSSEYYLLVKNVTMWVFQGQGKRIQESYRIWRNSIVQKKYITWETIKGILDDDFNDYTVREAIEEMDENINNMQCDDEDNSSEYYDNSSEYDDDEDNSSYKYLKGTSRSNVNANRHSHIMKRKALNDIVQQRNKKVSHPKKKKRRLIKPN